MTPHIPEEFFTRLIDVIMGNTMPPRDPDEDEEDEEEDEDDEEDDEPPVVREPDEGASYDSCQPNLRIPRKVLKGGSHLCAPNYCRRYRPAARRVKLTSRLR